MGVNCLPKTVTRHLRDCDLNPGPSAPESSTLTTRLPSQPIMARNRRRQKAEVSQQRPARLWRRCKNSNWPTGGMNQTGAESDIYDCLKAGELRHLFSTWIFRRLAKRTKWNADCRCRRDIGTHAHLSELYMLERAVHKHAARCYAALVKHEKRFYQRSLATRSTGRPMCECSHWKKFWSLSFAETKALNFSLV